ncbi:GNAT family N-acetyltransferase [Roseomonas sp. 18066]|uniref:GNAT family N-acetyltransferase n=1 Tax=Roseomonas sp. 18066 TaxID=2681412 RepID=UPI001359C48C|nr:GNAT family N-acetyltransferase [Roseomonas sp. 18066]
MVKLSHPAALSAGVSAVALASVRAEAGLVIRPATFVDRPALAELAAAAFAQGAAALLPAGLRRMADAARFTALFAEAEAAGATLLLAERDGRALGCVLAEPAPAEPGAAARLTGLWVFPGVTGQGIGSALLRALEELMASAGAGSLRVRVPSGHLRALGLFRRRGYAMQAAGRRTEPVLQVTLPHSVLAKPLLTQPLLNQHVLDAA